MQTLVENAPTEHRDAYAELYQSLHTLSFPTPDREHYQTALRLYLQHNRITQAIQLLPAMKHRLCFETSKHEMVSTYEGLIRDLCHSSMEAAAAELSRDWKEQSKWRAALKYQQTKKFKDEDWRNQWQSHSQRAPSTDDDDGSVLSLPLELFDNVTNRIPNFKGNTLAPTKTATPNATSSAEQYNCLQCHCRVGPTIRQESTSCRPTPTTDSQSFTQPVITGITGGRGLHILSHS